MSLHDTFDKVVVINLRRQPDRLAAFYESLPPDWPFKKPTPVAAIDGEKVGMPPHWKAGSGAWGCFRSHYQILAEALNDGIESVLVLEDDVICCDWFAERTAAFFAAVPSDWQWVYLGGQHIERGLGLPVKINDLVYRPLNVHRTHAFGFRGRAIMKRVFRHLNSPEDWGKGRHVDHRLGELHKDLAGGVYVPARWMIGQREGYSNIKRKQVAANFFPDAEWLLEIGRAHV